MTDEQLVALTNYVNACACVLELRDWRFRVFPEPPSNPRTNALFRKTLNRRVGSLWFSDGFLQDTPDAQRQTVAHELLHAHLNPLLDVVANVETNLGSVVYDVWHESFIDTFESAVDAIAYAVAPLLPLPELPRS